MARFRKNEVQKDQASPHLRLAYVARCGATHLLLSSGKFAYRCTLNVGHASGSKHYDSEAGLWWTEAPSITGQVTTLPTHAATSEARSKPNTRWRILPPIAAKKRPPCKATKVNRAGGEAVLLECEEEELHDGDHRCGKHAWRQGRAELEHRRQRARLADDRRCSPGTCPGVERPRMSPEWPVRHRTGLVREPPVGGAIFDRWAVLQKPSTGRDLVRSPVDQTPYRATCTATNFRAK